MVQDLQDAGREACQRVCFQQRAEEQGVRGKHHRRMSRKLEKACKVFQVEIFNRGFVQHVLLKFIFTIFRKTDDILSLLYLVFCRVSYSYPALSYSYSYSDPAAMKLTGKELF